MHLYHLNMFIMHSLFSESGPITNKQRMLNSGVNF